MSLGRIRKRMEMDAVKELVQSIGLGPVWSSVIIILLTASIYLLKKYIDLKSKLETISAEYRIDSV